MPGSKRRRKPSTFIDPEAGGPEGGAVPEAEGGEAGDDRSRSEKKRAVQACTAFGLQLVQTKPADLAGLDMDDELREAIALCQGLSKNARSRQLRLVGKLLRTRDVDQLRLQLERGGQEHQLDVEVEHDVARAREALLSGGDAALAAFIEECPAARLMVSELRVLIRQASGTHAGARTVRARRELFRLLRGFRTAE